MIESETEKRNRTQLDSAVELVRAWRQLAPAGTLNFSQEQQGKSVKAVVQLHGTPEQVLTELRQFK